ncbi:elongation factor Ts, mitochondrial-like isoform X2 [Limulus polyphemus]|uniref:Elongation factor Ts, mitochondrial n=1 Tax=Limulus polyphemus TaxID=6850 RepID=A0ABM1SBA1_LIMPO|nr:elongation factor Ts, mitochondrial-like isoform X2 [Limulus polyphemus]XP_022240905.1 elongation factor Ts, mitochondrial-like isoform X2 [Limulus polyphemus]XP_022240906.1 elongation factor Ts, mitochondrial-like isoform X2 [Limulus polyphemus]
MLFQDFCRFFHTTGRWRAINKSALAKLRKTTGYSFTNCKKALDKFEGNIEKAEEWLRTQAQEQGWAKAAHVQGRKTVHGLIGIHTINNMAAIVEVNCETDFVAKNIQFQELVKTVTTTCLHHTWMKEPYSEYLSKLNLSPTELGTFHSSCGKSLLESIALTIGHLGENIVIKRAVCMKSQNDVVIAGYTHPIIDPIYQADVAMIGKYGTLVAVRQTSEPALYKKQISLEQLGRDLCQHIIGMNPLNIGQQGESPSSDPEAETRMLQQEFLLDPQLLVADLLFQAGAEVLDFVRFECGEAALEKD